MSAVIEGTIKVVVPAAVLRALAYFQPKPTSTDVRNLMGVCVTERYIEATTGARLMRWVHHCEVDRAFRVIVPLPGRTPRFVDDCTLEVSGRYAGWEHRGSVYSEPSDLDRKWPDTDAVLLSVFRQHLYAPDLNDAPFLDLNELQPCLTALRYLYELDPKRESCPVKLRCAGTHAAVILSTEIPDLTILLMPLKT